MAKSEILRERLEVFINRYYKNQLIKGAIYAVSLGAMYFFIVAMAEYFGRFGSTTRLVLLIGLLLGVLVILGVYIIYPLSKLLKLGKRISYEKAAGIIGKYFPEVDDKLLNAIQLDLLSDSQSGLIQASIDQKIERLSPVPFTRAIDFKENKKYWPVLVIPVLVFVGVAVTGEWGSFTESGRRIAEFNKEFIEEAPFQFVLLNENRKVEEGATLTVRLSIEGDKVPTESFVVIGGEEMRMTKVDEGFQLVIPSVLHDFTLRFQAMGFYSQSFDFDVIPIPQLNDVVLKVVPPAYTGLKGSYGELKTVHDIPEGSVVSWKLSSSKVDRAWFLVDSVDYAFKKDDDQHFSFSKGVRGDLDYSIDVANEEVRKRGLSGNKLRVIKDHYPEIKVDFQRDSLEANVVYYAGSASDDYGLSKMVLFIEKDGQVVRRRLGLSGGINERFGDVLSLDSLAGRDGSTVKVYLKVWDNDGVNGAKVAISQAFLLELKGEEERKEELNEGYQKYFEAGDEKQEEREELRKSIEEFKRSLLEKKSLSFKEKSKLKELLEKQEKLLEKQQQNDELKKKLEREEENLGLKKEELKEEEKKIDELKEKDKEIEDLMKEIQELMEKLDTDKLKEKLDQLEKMNESNQRMDKRREDMLKDLQFKKDLLESAEKLQNLGEEMKKLGQEEGDSEEELKKQEEIKKEFEEVKEKIEEMEKENSQLGEENEKEGLKEKGEQADQEMNKAGDKLDQKDSKGANDSQKKAGEKMQEMSQSLQSSMMSMQSQGNKENIETLRQILENLETVSFGIEELAGKSSEIRRDDPGIKKLLTEQKRLMLGTKLIEDSLLALASRAPQIEQLVFDELDDMKYNLDKGIDNLQELETGKAASHQQHVMTAANNLALMLDESLQNMMQQQAQMMEGQQQCQKPGSKPNGKSVKQMQGEMGKMMDRIKEGQKKGEGGKLSKEMVETISKQEQLRQALEEMQKEEGTSGSKGNRKKAIEELKKLQEDLMDGRIDDNYKERLKEIETRLLESEKADLKQKKDEKRESKSSEDLKQLYSEELKMYMEDRSSENEVLDKLPVEYKMYYKGQTNYYLSNQ